MSNCKDNSFGLVGRDIQVTNAKVNDILAACKNVSENEISPTWTLAAFLQSNTPTVLTVPTTLVFTDVEMAQPAGFVSDSNGVFTIPVSGLWKITLNLAVNELAGSATDAAFIVNVNNQTLGAVGSVFDIMGFSTIGANQTVWLSSSVCKILAQGDTFTIQGFQIFGASPDLQVLPGVQPPMNSLYKISRICIEFVESV